MIRQRATIGRMHGSGWYARCTDLFQMNRPSWAECSAAAMPAAPQPLPGSHAMNAMAHPFGADWAGGSLRQ